MQIKTKFRVTMPNYRANKALFILAAATALICQSLWAMPASPIPFETHQPDGKKIRLYVRGDERFHWFEDTEGYTVVRDKRRYAYGRLDSSGQLKATALTVGTDNPKEAGLKKNILPSIEVRRSLLPALMSGESSVSPPEKVPPTGTVKNLVVLCLFADHTIAANARPPGDYDILFNRIGGDATLAPTGSVKDLYLENSYGIMTLESTVTVWVTLPNTEAYYADNEDGTGTYPQNAQGMVEDALNLVDPLVDFSQFDDDGDGYIDAIDIIHSGYGAETGGGGGDWIWSHRWSLWALDGGEWTSAEGVKVYDYHTEPALWGTSGTNIVRFGVIAHETGHFFGLPDLYDTDGSGEGIGSWGMMANSWGFDYSQYHPPHFSAQSKIELGWVTPTLIGVPGVYTVDQAETNPQVYRIDHNYPAGEYLLIENRQPAGIETAIPQGGLCIYHIDELADDVTEGYPGQIGWPQNGNHYRVAILQADGDYDLEKNNNRGDSGDLYHAAGVSEISPVTVPNTHAYQSGIIIITDNVIRDVSSAAAAMTFTYNNGTVPLPPQAYDMGLITDVDTPLTITLQAVDDTLPNPPGELDFTILSLPSHGILTDIHSVAITEVPHTLANNENQVIYTPRLNCRLSATFDFIVNDGGIEPEGGDSNMASVTVNMVDLIHFTDMDIDPGWTFTGKYWAWGVPTGLGGAYGNPDPTSGYTGSNVIGYNLLGDYRRIRSTEWATTPAIDCTAMASVTLSFYRWLNVEAPTYDHAYIEVSNDGGTWNRVWENAGEITDSSWNLQTYDISEFADDQPTVYVRWGMGVTDNKWHYSGWNIDDVRLLAANPVLLGGDFDADCDVDSSDLIVLAMSWLQDNPLLDIAPEGGDGIINLMELQILAENWISP